MSNYEELPENYEADTTEFDALYVALWLAIFAVVGKLLTLPSNATANYVYQTQRQINNVIDSEFSNLTLHANEWVEKELTLAYVEGLKYSRLALKQESDLNGFMPVLNDDIEAELNDSHMRRLDALIQQTQNDLLLATKNTSENIKRVVRSTVAQEINNLGRTGKIDVKGATDRITKNLRKNMLENNIKNADVAIVDKAGRKWHLSTYSSMVARTQISNAYVSAIRQEGIDTGFDLAVISTKPDTVDACLNYEGMVISLNGLTSGYLTYEGIRNTKECFHPNCGHFLRPLTAMSVLPKEKQNRHKKQMEHYQKHHK